MIDKTASVNSSYIGSSPNQEKPPIDNSQALRIVETQILQATDRRKNELNEVKEIILTFKTGDKVKLTHHKFDKPDFKLNGEIIGYKASKYRNGWRLIIKIEDSENSKLKQGDLYKLKIDHLDFSESDNYAITTNLDFNRLEFVRNCTGDRNIKTNDPNWQERIGNGMYRLYELEKTN